MNPRAFGAACIAAVVAVTVLTVLGELAAPLKAALASLTGHHWVSKGLLAALVFAVAVPLAGRVGEPAPATPRRRFAVTLTVAACTLILAAFFVLHHLRH